MGSTRLNLPKSYVAGVWAAGPVLVMEPMWGEEKKQQSREQELVTVELVEVLGSALGQTLLPWVLGSHQQARRPSQVPENDVHRLVASQAQ